MDRADLVTALIAAGLLGVIALAVFAAADGPPEDAHPGVDYSGKTWVGESRSPSTRPYVRTWSTDGGLQPLWSDAPITVPTYRQYWIERRQIRAAIRARQPDAGGGQ